MEVQDLELRFSNQQTVTSTSERFSSTDKCDISVVIPVYRAEECLVELHERLTVVLEKMGLTYELVLVEDRGTDKSWPLIRKLSTEDHHIHGIRLSRNFGQHAAITAGLSQARGNWAVVMDCDLQDPPEEIPRFFSSIQRGYDVVLAKRRHKRQSLSRRLIAAIYFRLLSIFAMMDIDGSYGTFSIISRKVIDAYLLFSERNRHYLMILCWLGFSTISVEYDHGQRLQGGSSYSFKALALHALQGIFFQTTILLQIIVYVGLAASLFGLCSALYLIVSYFAGPRLPGWTSLIVLLLLTGGVILMSLGAVGLYIGEIFHQLKGRPLFVIDRHIVDGNDT
jgi:glycosyltransferase involved in cell wall biosynthesis